MFEQAIAIIGALETILIAVSTPINSKKSKFSQNLFSAMEHAAHTHLVLNEQSQVSEAVSKQRRTMG